MNRAIKFRAFDTADKIMWEPLTLEQLIMGRWEMETADQSSSLPHNDYTLFAHNDTIWMQFTGLQDKNKKDIYEGDILYCHEYDSSDTGQRIVQTFNNAVVGFNYGNCYYHPNGNMQQPHQLLMYAYKPEIIGNKYENPELIK